METATRVQAVRVQRRSGLTRAGYRCSAGALVRLTGVTTADDPVRLAVSPARLGRMRERRGRGKRGPQAVPGPLSPRGIPLGRSSRQQFDDLVLAALDRLRPRLGADLATVEFAVEDTPLLPDSWGEDEVPLTSVVQIPGTDRTRVVLFRLPVSHRAEGERMLENLVFTLVVEQLALVWGRDVDDIDPRP